MESVFTPMGANKMKRDVWKQDSPSAQYTALLFSLFGSIENAKQGIKTETSLNSAQDFVDQLFELKEYLDKNPHIWIND